MGSRWLLKESGVVGKAKGPKRRERKQPVLPEGFLTTAQAIKELGVSAATLRRWVKEGRVEAVKIGKQLRFRQTDVRGVVKIALQTATAATEPAPAAEVRRCEQAIDRLLEEQGVRAGELQADVLSELKCLPKEHDITAARLLAKILQLAVESGASDVHIEPSEGGAKVRARVDGVLADMISLSKGVNAAVVAELRRWSNLNVEDRLRPQDGRFVLNLAKRDIDFLLSIMPAVFGDVVALRLLDRAVQLPDLSRVGFEADQLERWMRIIHRPSGLILLNGPSGCGKTTVLYATLQKLASPAKKIMTAEDPVEYTIPGVSQVQIQPSIGFDFAAAARHMMRQALNIFFIGEIRDRETAEILCNAALTGHLVFSTMHADDAILCIRRLLDMGVEPHVLASSLQAVTAQRLVRRICLHCKEEYRPTGEEYTALNVPADKQTGKFHRGKGCGKCRNLGYRGRVAVIQLLELNSRVREGIVRGDDDIRLREAARPAGFRLMSEIARDKILRGETTIEEVVRAGLAAQAAE
jgi:excisionase family DNA binding protein